MFYWFKSFSLMTEVETANFTSGLSAQVANVMRAALLQFGISLSHLCELHTWEFYSSIQKVL